MAVRAGLRHAAASDMGRRRTNNEDRFFVDADRGIFAVIDGVGGQAAGEHAAETAREVIQERLSRPAGAPEQRLREAIALANNEIVDLARANPEWAGMACVLTVALIEDDVVTVGHVGDSRLYVLQPGSIRKITKDHSPVGEREDKGEISESEAMRHARRNEIYRDVGSAERQPEDPAFIEIYSFPMPPDGALLLCSDGLSDLLTSEEIRSGMERYAPDYEAALAALIDAANHAGGKDNITIVVVAAPGYEPQPVDTAPTVEMARRRPDRRWWFLAAGILLGGALGFGGPWFWSRFSPPGPKTFVVGKEGISAALALTHAGDTVMIPPGKYREQVRLREGVEVRAQQPGSVAIVPAGASPGVVAERIESGAINGVSVLSDPNQPATVGIEISDATIEVSNVYVTGAVVGIDIRGRSEPLIASSQVVNNLGAGIDVAGNARPRLQGNLIAANGEGKSGPAKPGIEVSAAARPVLRDNAIVNNAADAVWIHGSEFRRPDFAENFFGRTPLEEAVRLIDVPAARPPNAAAKVKR